MQHDGAAVLCGLRGRGDKRRETPQLVGGGLRRSNEGTWPKDKDRQNYDSRARGGSNFVETVLEETEKLEWEKRKLRGMGWEELVDAVSSAQGLEKGLLLEKGRSRAVSEGKAMLIYAGVRYFGKTNKAMAQMTSMAPPSASRAKERGRRLLEWLRLFSNK